MRLISIFLFITVSIFGSEFIQDDLIVGINRFRGKKIYISVEKGSAFFEIKNNEYYSSELKKGSVETIILSSNKLKTRGQVATRISLYKGSPESIIKISLDGRRFSKYRGDFEFIVYKNTILPLNSVESEEYIYSVVPSEIGHYFPKEAIKAQSLAARSYLYYGLRYSKYKDFDLFDNVNSQMYLGFDRENDKINKIIKTTQGEAILYNKRPINALYYSTSGGITASVENVWGGRPVPYLKSVDDRGNERSPKLNWEVKISKAEISKKMKFKVTSIIRTKVRDRRVVDLTLKGSKTKKINANKFRTLVGGVKLPSTMFTVKSVGNYFVFTGHGFGHGVGMSQYGSRGLAEQGKTYKQILKHYYTGVEIKKYNRNK